MIYTITLIIKKEAGEALLEIKKYIVEKKGKILTLNEMGSASLKSSKKAYPSSIYQLEIEITTEAADKIKKKIEHEKEVVSYLLEKKKIIKKVTPEKIKQQKTQPEKPGASVKKPDQSKKVLASMQEEEKKIKDLDSTLDKILNE